MLRTLAAASVCAIVCAIAACGTPPPSLPAPVVGQEPLSIGPAAQDTVGGWLPDDRTVSPFDADTPIVEWLDPALREAVQKAARSAEAEGIEMRITSGWRSKGFQERLFDDGVVRYGSVQAAREFVASPEKSKHVTGEAVDIGPVEADRWLIANGREFGLCQIYANEIWHFELAVVDGRCPPLKPNAAAD
ncbi:peptidase M15 [Mycobacterium sp. GA-1285]|uniref:M15 family metallopeptidase n=1 Tax=Mycobacterium sp. GA-1285 TaxID=1772282 RepID=UPI0007463717|nr:peptidase M15 [Mycobacterium sp. GA-1285]